MIRAKFKIISKIITQNVYQYNDIKDMNEMVTIVATPVYVPGSHVDGKYVIDENHPNFQFWSATPTGRLELGTVKPEVAAKFEIGKEYYVDFSLAE